jgi:hypothetical protein
MKRTTKIKLTYTKGVDLAVERFSDHEDMSEARMLRWLEQFSDADLPLVMRVIASVKYYNRLNLRTMTRQLFTIVSEEMREKGYQHVVFVAVGDAGAGSAFVARILRDLIRGTTHRLMSMLDLSRAAPGSIDAVVFVDDFSGTGQTLQTWWENVETLVRPTGAAVFVGLLVLNERARQRVEQLGNVLAVEELDDTQNIFYPQNQAFSDSEKARIEEHCRRTGCAAKYQRGFGGCGLLLAFKHGCPNNSLPVLWYSGTQWRPLFNRRAV